MTRQELVEIARGNVERHLEVQGESADSIFHEAYTLAIDALIDVDAADSEMMRSVAYEVAQCYAQP